MGFLSKFENTMEDGIEGAAGMVGRGGLSPVQIIKKAEKQMRRERIVGAGKQYAPTLYTVLVSSVDDRKLFKYYPTLAGETETYLLARAREMGYAMDGQPLVRFITDPELKRGKFDVVAEMVASAIVEQLREDEMERYGISDGRRRTSAAAAAARRGQVQPNMKPLPVREEAVPEDHLSRERAIAPQEEDSSWDSADVYPSSDIDRDKIENSHAVGSGVAPVRDSILGDEPAMVREGSREIGRAERAVNDSMQFERLQHAINKAEAIAPEVHDGLPASDSPVVTVPPMSADLPPKPRQTKGAGVNAVFGDVPYDDAMDSAETVDFSKRAEVYLYDEARDVAYQLTGMRQRIGRESANDIVVPDINISRVHAEIYCEPSGVWVVTDLNSTNGVFINGRKISKAPLRDADMLTLGTTTLEFQIL